MTTKKIAMIIAPDGFRDEEYFEPKEYFENQGYEVVTFSMKGTQIANGKLGGTAQVDDNIYNINEKDFDALVFSGGPGAKIFMGNEYVNKIIEEFYNVNKPVAAICISPVILAYSGILKGKNATVFTDDGMAAHTIEREGANFTPQEIEVEGNIITGNGPAVATDFAKEIVKKLEN